MTHGPASPFENAPTDDQKHRLSDWLTELHIICRKYQLVLDTEDGETRVIDLTNGHTIGIGLTYLTDQLDDGKHKITAFDCTGSILDGVWLINTPDGLQEQHVTGRTFPEPRTHLR